MGGEGLAPDPIQYCLYGLAACYAGTFAGLAAAQGVSWRSLGQRMLLTMLTFRGSSTVLSDFGISCL